MFRFGEEIMKATIGLEIHLALSTQEKLFSSTKNDFSVKKLSLFDCATPGVLPVLSVEPFEHAIAFGLAVGAEIKKVSIFERKHYFYPDLPLGYQITQQHEPILVGGQVSVGDTTVFIEHAHLECDAAKSIHEGQHTYIDLSRCASALLEIVSTPCMHSAKEASAYAKSIHELAIYLGICDGKLQEGSFRVDASVSVSNTDKLGTRVEIKNISSFRFLEMAIDYEIARQTQLIKGGDSVVMETRLFKEQGGTTESMRKKETVDEYRYLVDPDIPPLVLSEQLIDKVAHSYDTDFYQMKKSLCDILLSFSIHEPNVVAHKHMWKLFLEERSLQTQKIAKIIHYWLPVGKTLTASELIALSAFDAQQCKDILDKYEGKDLEELFPKQLPRDTLTMLVLDIVSQYPQQLLMLQQGDLKMQQFLIGKCLAQLKGKASAIDIKSIIEKSLVSTM